MFPTFKQRCNFVSKVQKTISAQIGPSTIVSIHFEGFVISSKSERVFLNHRFSLVSWGLVLSSEKVQKNPLCANRRRWAAVISRSRVYNCNEFAFYHLHISCLLIGRYLLPTKHLLQKYIWGANFVPILSSQELQNDKKTLSLKYGLRIRALDWILHYKSQVSFSLDASLPLRDRIKGNSPKQRTPPTHRYGLGLT